MAEKLAVEVNCSDCDGTVWDKGGGGEKCWHTKRYYSDVF